MIRDAFHLGGWGMWPTLICGVLLLGAAALYAARPDRRYVPLLLCFTVMTLVSGILGFSTGVVKSLTGLDMVPAADRYIYLIGVGESLVNIVWAFVLIMLATIAAAFGALRIARVPAALR